MNPNQGPRMTFEDNNVNFVYRSSLRIRYENIRKYRIMETGANWNSESLQRTLRGEGEGNRSIQVDPQLDVQPGVILLTSGVLRSVVSKISTNDIIDVAIS